MPLHEGAAIRTREPPAHRGRPAVASSFRPEGARRARPSSPAPTRVRCERLLERERPHFEVEEWHLGKDEALSHMVVLTDARQIDRRLLDLVARAAAVVNG